MTKRKEGERGGSATGIFGRPSPYFCKKGGGAWIGVSSRGSDPEVGRQKNCEGKGGALVGKRVSEWAKGGCRGGGREGGREVRGGEGLGGDGSKEKRG